MLRNFVKSRVSDMWRISGGLADRALRMASGPLEEAAGMAPAPVRTALAAMGGGAVTVMRTSMRIGEDLQRRAVDMTFDAAEWYPLTQAFAEAGTPLRVDQGKWSQPQPHLEYLKAVNDTGPARTSLQTILLAVAYSNARRANEGVETFEGYLEKFRGRATPRQRALYLSCLALLRGSAARTASAWDLPATILGIEKLKAELAEAIQLTENEPDYAPEHWKIFPRWVAGLLLANLPWPFAEPKTAMERFSWCESTITASTAAYTGSIPFMVETYFNLAALYRAEGNSAKAAEYLAKSGLTWDRPDILLVTPFSVSSNGLRDTPEYIDEVVPGRVFSALGFDISSMHFVISDDGSEVIVVDALSRIDRCQAAWRAFQEFYRTRYHAAPPVKTIVLTHFHWDHAGGLNFFKKADPSINVYVSAHYVEEEVRATQQPPPYSWFLGEEFNVGTLAHFDPDYRVESETTIHAGGTEIRLMPLPGGGGETPDGMFVYFPGPSVMFVGDIMVPWVGSPYVQEGSPGALLQTLAFTGKISPTPQRLVHGHTAMTLFYPTVPVILRMRPLLAWLYDETIRRIYAGQNRAQILADPLVPPGILDPSLSDLFFPYLIMREPFVSRVYVTTVGYWGAGLENVDALSDEQMGPVLAHHMDWSEDDFAAGIQRMIAAGDLDVAGRAAVWSVSRYPGSQRLQDLHKQVFQLLMQKYQMLNPFKLTMYANRIATPVPQLAPPARP